MNPSIRSHNELMIITQARDQQSKSTEEKEFNTSINESYQKERYTTPRKEKVRLGLLINSMMAVLVLATFVAVIL